MDILQALILGLIQGLTEFLPVSSSGHLELGSYLLGIENQDNLSFTVSVHAATVLSTAVVFRKDIIQLVTGFFKFQWNEETQFALKILLSMIPIAVLGLFFKEDVESLFTGNLVLVGCCLMITSILLAFAHFRKGDQSGKIGFLHSFIIGLAQAAAVMPGISRSGATIATGLLLGKNRTEVARFSFLMVLIPIVGAFFLNFIRGDFQNSTGIGAIPMAAGFFAAFISGLLACKLMIKLVTRGKLIYFSAYCLIVALIAIFAG